VQSTSEDRRSGQKQRLVQHGRDNEAETFVLGDDDDEEEASGHGAPRPEDMEPVQPPDARATDDGQPSALSSNAALPSSSTYYIKSRDTITGIALKYGVEVSTFLSILHQYLPNVPPVPKPRQLCRLNKLPVSTLTTTPHLLHTRTTLQLPPGSRAPSPPPPDFQERLEARARERAGRAFQAITKETDWGVAQTYVALLDVEDDGGIKEGKRRMVDAKSKEGKQALAIDCYLDDNAWEEEQRRAGLSPRIEGFPYFNPKGKENVEPQKEGSSVGGSDWWQKLWSGSSSKQR
jgi:hypothetical protein